MILTLVYNKKEKQQSHALTTSFLSANAPVCMHLTCIIKLHRNVTECAIMHIPFSGLRLKSGVKTVVSKKNALKCNAFSFRDNHLVDLPLWLDQLVASWDQSED